ncbi:unnamed protein product [Urochloa humidicola]
MLGAVLRVPAPIPLPTSTRPLLALRRCRTHCHPPGTPMASAVPRDGAGGATKPDAAPSPSPAPAPLPLPEPPEKPLPGDCCGSGCVRCVWDIYFDELDAYDKALAAHATSSSGTGSGGKDESAGAKPSSDGAAAKP